MIIFYPISLIFGFFVFVRAQLFKRGVFASYKVKTKVLSVGNLTFGGTGKTPTVDFLLTNLKTKLRIAVISRGYGRSTKGFYKVSTLDAKASDLYGDEPLLLASKHHDVPIFVCEDRVDGIRQIEGLGKFDLIIADDAFQHLKLKRDCDVVVIDATEKKTNYLYPPAGRARNSLCYLKKADFVFLTKTNLTSDYSWIRGKLKNKKVIEFESQLDGIYNLKTKQKLEMFPKEVYLMSGIGKPQTFDDLVKKSFGDIIIKKHFIFKDHHNYKQKDIDNVKSEIGNGILLTTEKDAIKLGRFSDQLNLNVVMLKFVNKSPMESFYEILY